MGNLQVGLPLGISPSSGPRPSFASSSSNRGASIHRFQGSDNAGRADERAPLLHTQSFAKQLRSARDSAIKAAKNGQNETPAAAKEPNDPIVKDENLLAVLAFASYLHQALPSAAPTDTAVFEFKPAPPPSSMVCPNTGQTAGLSDSAIKFLGELVDQLKAALDKVVADLNSPTGAEGLPVDAATELMPDLVYYAGAQAAPLLSSILRLGSSTPAGASAEESTADMSTSIAGALNSGLLFMDFSKVQEQATSSAGAFDTEPLQAIIDKLQALLDNPSHGSEEQSQDSALRQFLLTHANMQAAGPAPAFAVPPLAAAIASQALPTQIDAMQQTQAALADMVERMRGEVLLDTPSRRAVICLDPPSLGRLHVELRLDDSQRVVAQIRADQPATQDFLNQNREDLRRSFFQNGYEPDQVDIQILDGAPIPFGVASSVA